MLPAVAGWGTFLDFAMLWTTIRIEPRKVRARSRLDEACCFLLRLPIISDGRVAFAHLMRHPQEAVVERCVPGRRSHRGSIQLIDNQWTCVWDEDARREFTSFRLVGARFSLGDTVGLRPEGGAMSLYEVCEACPLLHCGPDSLLH